jgi:hypothetical protein
MDTIMKKTTTNKNTRKSVESHTVETDTPPTITISSSTNEPMVIDMSNVKMQEPVFCPSMQEICSIRYDKYPMNGTEDEIKKYFDDYFVPLSKSRVMEYESVWSDSGILNLIFKRGRVSFGVLFEKKHPKVEKLLEEVEMFYKKSLTF